MDISFFDYAIIGSYLILLLIFGFYFSVKKISPQRFMIAGGILPGWLVGLSLTATDISSIAFLGFPSKTFAGDWSPLMVLISFPLIVWLVSRYIIPFFRKQNIVSVYSYLGERFGKWASTYASHLFVIFQISRIGMIIYLLSLVLSTLTGVDPIWVIIVTGMIVTFYSYTGGIEAVIWTDFIQAFLYIAGGIGCLVFIMTHMPEGPQQLVSVAAADNKLSLGNSYFSLSQETIWVFLLFGFALDFTTYAFNQGYVQRYIAAKSLKDARQSIWLGATMTFFTGVLFFAIGIALYSYYNTNEALLAIASTSKSDAIFPHFIATQIPAGLKGLVIIAILAASMSSMDTALNCASTVFLCNICKKKDRSDKESISILHKSSLAIGIIAIIVGIILSKSANTILDFWWQLISLFAGGLTGLFLLGMFSSKVTGRQGLISLCLGTIVTFWIATAPHLPESLAYLAPPLHPILSIVFGNMAVIITGLLLSRFNSAPQIKVSQPTCDEALIK